MEAINKNYNSIMDMFIKFGADVNIINFKNGNTAIHYAVMN
jgi:ankyrin repeat protein